MTLESWEVFPAGNIEKEDTELTDRAQSLMIRLARRELEERWGESTGGPEMRLMVRDKHGRPLYVISVWGQTPATAHGKTGAHPDRIAYLRELDYPVMFLAIQGDVGWMTWLLPGHEPRFARIDKGAGEMRRQGWKARDMTKVVFSDAAAARHPDATYFRFPERAPEPNLEGVLF